MTSSFDIDLRRVPVRENLGGRGRPAVIGRVFGRLLLGAAAAVASLGLAAGAAQAHVTVRPDNTASGAFSALTFRVPNESPSAGTVKMSVDLPTDRPFLYVSTKPVPGWRASVVEGPLPQPVETDGTTITKAARTVTWTAEGPNRIAPGEYQEFALSVGPLPPPGPVLLPAEQTYSDGGVVRWDQPVPVGGEEPEHPAPVLTVTAAGEGEDAHDSGAPAEAATADDRAAADPVARGLGGAALAVGAVGAVLGGLSLRRRRTGLA